MCIVRPNAALAYVVNVALCGASAMTPSTCTTARYGPFANTCDCMRMPLWQLECMDRSERCAVGEAVGCQRGKVRVRCWQAGTWISMAIAQGVEARLEWRWSLANVPVPVYLGHGSGEIEVMQRVCVHLHTVPSKQP